MATKTFSGTKLSDMKPVTSRQEMLEIIRTHIKETTTEELRLDLLSGYVMASMDAKVGDPRGMIHAVNESLKILDIVMEVKHIGEGSESGIPN
jgi:hypothetical protein